MTPTPLHRQAIAAYRAGDQGTAATCCAEILKRKRDDVEALVLMAQIAQDGGRGRDATGFMTRAVTASPRDARLRARLGRLLLMHGEHGKALAQYEKALKTEPGLPEALGGMAETYERQGKHDKGLATLRPLLDRGAPPPTVAPVAIRLLVHDGAIDDAVRVGEAVRVGGHAPSMMLRDTLFALAKAYEKNDHHDAAFDAARAANAMGAAPFDPAQFDARIDEFIDTFSADRLASLPRPAVPSDLPVFIVGVPRCGSTLVERIIDAHPDAHGAGEHPAMFLLANGLPERLGSAHEYPRCAADLTAEHIEATATEYVETMRKLDPKAARVTNKDLGCHRHLGLIEVVLPKARVIHCRRDPVDNCLSCYMEPLRPGSVPYASDLAHLGSYYRAYRRLMRHWRDVLDLDVLDIDYEDIVADPAAVSRRIVEFCGLPWDDACLRFHETRRADRTLSYDQVRRPVYATSVGRAARFGPHLDPLREALGDEATR